MNSRSILRPRPGPKNNQHNVQKKEVKKIKSGIYGKEDEFIYYRKVFDGKDILQNEKSPKYVLPLNKKYSVKAYLESYKKYRPDVMFYVRNNQVFGSKVELWETLRKYYGRDIAKTIVPETFILPKNKAIFNRNYQKGKYYILKNKKQRQRGIKITNDHKEILNHKKNGFTLVQHVITNPLLYKGYKFNLRIYFAVICDNKNNVNAYIYNDGIVNYANQQYDPENVTFENSITSGDNYEKFKEYPIIISDFLKEFPIDNLFLKVKYKLRMVVKAAKSMIQYTDLNVKSIQLFGADILIDENKDAHLLEMNIGPGMIPYNDKDDKVRHGMISELIELVNNGSTENYIPL